MTDEAVCPLTHHSDPTRPRRATYGPFCGGHHQGILDALHGLPSLYDELAERLMGSGGGDGPRAHDDATGLDLDPHVVEARTAIRSQLVGWTRITLEDGPWKYPPTDSIRDICAWLGDRLDWILCQPWAPDFADEVIGSWRHGRALIQPNNVYRIELGPCPELLGEDQERCPGTVIAVMRKATARELLPSVVHCTEHGNDPDEPHAWEPMQWHTPGRRMGRGLHTSAAEAFMRGIAG